MRVLFVLKTMHQSILKKNTLALFPQKRNINENGEMGNENLRILKITLED